jgi:hypothetical protein
MSPAVAQLPVKRCGRYQIQLRAKKEADRLHKETEGDRQAVRQVLNAHYCMLFLD